MVDEGELVAPSSTPSSPPRNGGGDGSPKEGVAFNGETTNFGRERGEKVEKGGGGALPPEEASADLRHVRPSHVCGETSLYQDGAGTCKRVLHEKREESLHLEELTESSRLMRVTIALSIRIIVCLGGKKQLNYRSMCPVW